MGVKGNARASDLKLANFKKKPRVVREAGFEKRLARALPHSWHISSRDPGWPDRYVVGGIWIEVKSLKYMGDQHQLSPEQIAKLKELTKAGDKCFYCAKYDDILIFEPWEVFYANGMSPEKCIRYAYKDLDEVIKYVLP